jgi:membrane-associated protease RseP (regulator of RpoE activity)
MSVATRPAPPSAPPPPSPAPGRALLRLAVAIVAVAALFVAIGLGDLFLVIVAIVVMVMVHEAGHFATAKWSHMKVTEFFVGFGPRLWSVRRGETEYGIKAIPAGGYVKIPGMTNLEEIDPLDEPRTYRQQPFRKRILVASAGSFMHFVMAFLLAWAALVFVGTPSNTKETIEGFSTFAGQKLNPAQRAGLAVGDVIVGVGGHPLRSEQELADAIEHAAGRRLSLEIERNGAVRTVIVVPESRRHLVNNHEQRSGEIGIEFSATAVPENPFGALGGAGVVVAQTTRDAFTGLGQVFSPSGLSNYIHEVANPTDASRAAADNTPRPESIIGAVRTAVQGAQAGSEYLLEVLIALNIFIAIVNMLPMLPLDGGHVVIAIYERIRTRRGRPYYQADAAKLAPIAYGFVVLLILLVTSAAYLDITHPVANPFG